jgi:hypothetical protein
MSVEVKGTLKHVFDKQTFSSGFEKREFILTTKEQYPQDLKIELVNDKCNLIDSFVNGQELVAHVNLRGSEYQGKYYVSLQGWKVENA